MPHIDLPPLPGLAALLVGHPETAGPLTQLAETLLRGPSPLTPLEREIIGTYVSRRNECTFCAETHAAVARQLGGADGPGPDAGDGVPPGADPKLRALLAIAEKVRVDGRSVTAEDVERARAAGADDRSIHDTVLVAAAFCMFNRYVDGLGTALPDDPEHYQRHGGALAANGYLRLPA
ncbi:carboxymuconolactone decarboxylase family protein [Jidongwangia harbinensis]|uniref:carboxymuconolactone decarboxylase family protein n=1 Tax=Jidongwangia harbinensis TaxID=2878561 RepID=UPI001CD99E64|nr:carboxymuconolactone decarboxylase family protein [Jidongwangia harbinensis]MCA2218242.1 carboxymuconolactone decarboxylase family protein [Jidongwangia harbinensis]